MTVFFLLLTHFECSTQNEPEILDDGAVSQQFHSTKPLTNGVLLDWGRNDNSNGRHETVTPATGSGSRTPAGDDWELDCEICHRHGINLVCPRLRFCIQN
jgi:hypothetical protein